MKKVLKWFGIILVGLIAIGFIAGWIASEPLPEGKTGPEAEALAQKVMQATNQAAWDTTVFVSWGFAGQHQLLWDRNRKLVQVEWESKKVLLNTQNQEGKAWEDDTILTEEEARKALDEAWSYFCNDSFWLNAPSKIYDPGTSRKLVELEDGSEGLLLSYSSGGVTPGDSYLWILDENGLPVKWKMWVSLIPIGGIEASWDNWQDLTSGAKIAKQHVMGPYTLIISDLKAGNNWTELGISSDPFAPLF